MNFDSYGWVEWLGCGLAAFLLLVSVALLAFSSWRSRTEPVGDDDYFYEIR